MGYRGRKIRKTFRTIRFLLTVAIIAGLLFIYPFVLMEVLGQTGARFSGTVKNHKDGGIGNVIIVVRGSDCNGPAFTFSARTNNFGRFDLFTPDHCRTVSVTPHRRGLQFIPSSHVFLGVENGQYVSSFRLK